MAKSDSLMRMGHRERLREKFKAGFLDDADELELLLTYIIQRRDVRILARRLKQRFGSAYNTILANGDDIMAVDGAGPGVALFFKLLRSILERGYSEHVFEVQVFKDPETIKNYCRTKMAHKRTEEMHVMYLDAHGRVISEEINDVGTVNKANVYPDKILARALTTGASRIILFHNHPIGDEKPSINDVSVTEALGKILAEHNITIYDHLVIDSRGAISSMRDSNVLALLDKQYIKK